MDKAASYTRYYGDNSRINVNFRESSVTCYTSTDARNIIEELESVTKELEQFARDRAEGYDRFVCDRTGYVVITKNDQPVNFYADAGSQSCDYQWQWVDPLFVQLVIEFGVTAAIDKTLYCRDASM